jgi:predicted amidophosphoribosyltransferase
MFTEFKIGESTYAYPLALGIFKVLSQEEEVEFDGIIPIPLSPDKARAGEMHRTKALSQELGKLLGVPVREYLSLDAPISKRRMQSEGSTPGQFRQRYYTLLRVDEKIGNLTNVLLIDDVITHGWTISCAVKRLRESCRGLRIIVASAGRMIIKGSVARQRAIVE